MNFTRAFSNRNLLLLITLLGILVTTMVLSHRFRKELDFKRIPLIFQSSHRKTVNQVRCLLVTNLQTDDLRFQISIPCENARQKKELYKIMPKIRHELLMSMNRPEIALEVKERKFEDFRSYLLNVINSVSPKPIKEIYFESFFCN